MTKELISLFLENKYKVLKSIGNHNNHIGIPLALTKLNNNYDIVVLELGMNHKGEISKLSKMCKPNISVITNIGTAHIGNLGSKKKIYKAKMEIIDGMQNGTLIVNGEDYFLRKSNGIKCIYNGKIISNLNEVKFYIGNKEFILNMPGKYLISNVLLALKVGEILGISLDEMQHSLLKYKPLDSRLNVINKNNNIIIDDCYNSNFESVIGLLDILDNIDKNITLILGDILELGKYTKKIHTKIGKILKNKNYQKVILVGNNMYYAHKKYKKSIYFQNTNELINYLKDNKTDNIVIAIKASRNMHFENIKKIV